MKLYSDLNLLPAAAEEAKEQHSAANYQVSEHRHPGAKQAPVASGPITQESQMKRFHGKQIGQGDAHAHETDPGEENRHARVARASERISEDHCASDKRHGKGHQPENRHADFHDRLLLILRTKKRKHRVSENKKDQTHRAHNAHSHAEGDPAAVSSSVRSAG